MSTCHQAHNIPWDALISLLERIPLGQAYIRMYPQHINSFSLRLPPDPEGVIFRRMTFFAAKFASAIKQFSATERSKYANKDIDNLTELYSSESSNEWLPPGPYQTSSRWLSDVKAYRERPVDQLKQLFIQDKCLSLLHLARQGFPIERYLRFPGHIGCGLKTLQEDSLSLYIHLNILLATGTLQTPDKWHTQWKQFLQCEVFQSHDRNYNHVHMYNNYFHDNPNFEDLQGLQDLLKKLFRMLYIYDMVLAERNVKVSWENYILSCLRYFLNQAKKGYEETWFQYLIWKQI